MKTIKIDLIDTMVSTLYTCLSIEQIDNRQETLMMMIFTLYLFDAISIKDYSAITNILMENANKARTIQMHKDIARGINND